jgi:hypothetical protein
MPDERLDGGPVDESMRIAAPAREPAEQASRASVDAGDHPSRGSESQLDVVGDHEPPGVDADQPAAEDVLSKQNLALAALEVREVEILTGELHAPEAHLGDAISGNEQPAPGNAADQTGHGWIAALGEPGDDIVHPAEASTRSVDERAAQNPGECEPARLGSRLPGV